jgi:hypothetical protein
VERVERIDAELRARTASTGSMTGAHGGAAGSSGPRLITPEEFKDIKPQVVRVPSRVARRACGG